MYNTNAPSAQELPSNAQLIKATLGSLAIAVVLLVTCILPAEYAIDPTGLGEKMGLLRMGEIKVQLDKEAHQEEASPIAIASESEQVSEPQSAQTVSVSAAPLVQEIVLKPNEAAELKLLMSKHDTVSYLWRVDTGHVNYDTHGDNPSTRYHNYNKGKAAVFDQGTLTADFDGKHGWFWRNRSPETVKITLEIEGSFAGVERVL